MAKFTLTPGIDHFTGVAGENNTFDFKADTLQPTDVITGATGGFLDVMALTATGTVTFGQFAGVSGIEQLRFDVPGSVELSNELVGSGPGLFQVDGSAGADTIDGSHITNSKGLLVFAGDGSDTVTGGNGDDTLVAHTIPNLFTQEHDTLSGGAGNDTLFGEAADTLDGGTGFDVLQAINDFAFNLDLVATSIEYVVSGFGNDIYTAASDSTAVEVYGAGGNDQITGGSGNDNLWGGVGNDTLTGNDGNDLLVGDLGADILSGGIGNDRLYIDSDDTSIDGGSGFDAAYIATGTGVHLNMATTHLEWVADFAGSDDTIDGSGVSVNLEIYGAGGNDTLTGGSANDLIFAGSGNDTVVGGSGDDALVGEAGADSLSAGAGNDRLYVDSSDTLIDGGADMDAVYIEGGSGLTLNMATSNVEFIQDDVGGNDTINGVGSAMRVFAAGGDDTIGITSSAFTTISGGGGLDRLALTVASQSFDVTANVSKITGIEVISLSSSLGASLALTSTDISQITSGNSLYVTGAADDTITVGGTGWTVVTTTHTNPAISGDTFIQYHNSVTGSELYVADSINGAPSGPNEPPENTAPTTVTATEDTTFPFDGGNTISVADPDLGANVSVTLSVDHGVLNVSPGPGISGNGTDTITIGFASPATVNAILANLTYQGDANFNGNDTLTIVSSDGALSDTDTVAITVGAVNDKPVAADDLAYATAEDTPLVLAVLGNDTDVDGPLPLAVARVNGAAVSVGNDVGVTGGSVHVNADGTLTFTPTLNFSGTASFNYTPKDGAGLEAAAAANVSIAVSAVNDAPAIAAPASAAPSEDVAFGFTGGNAIAISDVDAGSGNVTVTLNVGHGTLTAGGAGVSGSGTASVTIVDTVANANTALATLSYTGDSNFHGADGLTVSVNDGGNTGAGGAQSASKTIVLNVASVNDAPVGTAASYTINEDSPLAGSVAGTDVDGDSLSFSLVAGSATNGAAAVNPDGTFTFTPTANFSGDASFQFKANDGTVDSVAQTVTIHVTPVNDAPMAGFDSVAVNEDGLAATGLNVLANDTDIDASDTKSVVSFTVNGTTHTAGNAIALGNGASLNVSAAGAVTLTQNGAYESLRDGDSASIAFSYTMEDAAHAQSTAGVQVTVNGINDAPTLDLDTHAAGNDFATLETSGGSTAIASDPAVTDGAANAEGQIKSIALHLTAASGGIDTGEALTIPASVESALESLGIATITGSGTDTLTITATTFFTPAVAQSLIAQITHSDPDTTFAFNADDRSISVTVTDLNANGNPNAAVTQTTTIDMAADVTDLNGAGQLDSFTGANRADIIRGAAGDDTMEGRGGNDTIYGGTELGDSGHDTAVFTGNQADYTVTRTGPGVYTVADSVPSRDGTDTVHDVETLHFNGDASDLLLDAPIQVFDATDTILLASFAANQLNLAVNYANTHAGANVIELQSSASPFTATAWPVDITEAVTIKAVGGSATVNAGSNSAFQIEPSAVLGASDTVRLDGLNIVGDGLTADTYGVRFTGVYEGPSDGTIQIINTAVSGFGSDGVYINGGGAGLTVTIDGDNPNLAGTQTATFTGSGYSSTSGGSGDILFFEFTGAAALKNLSVVGTTGVTAGSADNGIQFAGFDGADHSVDHAIGSVSFQNVSVSGTYEKTLVYVQGYDSLSGLSLANGLTLGGAGSQTTWAALFIDGGPQGGAYVNGGTSTLDLTGVVVSGGSYGTSPSFVALGSKPIVVNGVLTGDVITGTSAAEAFIGSTGDDTINAGGGADLVLYNIGDGHDTVDGQGGTDTLGLINFSAGAPSATLASFAISESGGHLAVQTDNAGLPEVDAAGMESVQLVLGNGGDTVTLSGNIAGAGIATGPGGIVVSGGTGGDTLDASGLTSASAVTFSSLGGGNDTFKAANVAANDTADGGSGSGDTLDYAAASAAVTIDLNAGTASGTTVGSDTVANYENATGGAGGDSISGTVGANTLSGNGGDDTLTGRGGADILTGGETGETHGDVAAYSQVITAGMIATNLSGGWTVTTGSAEGTDTLSEIEVVQGADPAGLATGKFLLVGNGGYATYDAAYAEAVDGDTIVLAAGTYGGDHIVGKAISIVGANYNVSGAGARGAESVLTGHWTVNAAGPVTIDGVEFLNGTPWVSGTNDTRLAIATGATVAHSVFYTTRPGGDKPISDIGINVTATSGTVSVLDNLFSGDSHGKYFAPANGSGADPSAASWGGGTNGGGNAGAIVWGGGSTLDVDGNTIQYARTALNITGDDALLTVNANHFVTNGTAITATGWQGPVTGVTGNTFTDVDNEINDRFEASGVSINLSSNTSDNWFSYLGGIGGDTITGTAGKDAILANQGNDTVHTLQGNDSVFVNVNTGNDIVDGGSETAGKDTLIVSNVGISGGNGNALDPGDAGDPATSTAGSPSAAKVTYTMTPDSANTVHPTDGTDSTDDISVTMATTIGATPLGSVTADEVEDVQFNLGSGGDTVNISGDFTNTSLSGSTITVVGGSGADTVDARNLSSTHAIHFNGNGGDDYFYVSGAGGNDTFDGGGGTNTIDYSDVGHGVTVDLGNGAAQSTGDGSDTISNVQNVVGTGFGDTLTGTAGANQITGGGGVDTAGYGGTLSTAATFSFDGSGHWTVTIGGVTDTLIGVERLTFSDKTVLLVDQSGANVGGFQHVQDAIDFASGGETILIKGGLTYSESHTTASGPAGIYIDKSGLTLQGVTAAGALITDAATAQSAGPTIVSAHQNNFGANHWVDVNGDSTTFSGVHLKAGPETDNKVLEFWADNVTVQNSFVDVYKTVAGPSEVYTFAVAIYINDNGSAATDEVTTYTIDGNILNEGIIVANGVGDPSLGIGAGQKITDNQFIDTFDYNTGLGRYDTIVINGQVNGIGWLLEPTQTPTITGNTVANNTVPFLLRGSDNSATNLPTAAQIAVILANNFSADTSYAYVVDSTTGDLVLAHRDDGSGPYRSFAVTNTIDTLNLALDTTGDNVFGGQRDYIHAGDTVVVQSGDTGTLNSSIMVENLTVRATAHSGDLNLTLATQYADGSPIPAGGVHNVTLADYAAGQGANVDVTGNALDNVIIGNSGNNNLNGGAGDDTLTGGKGADTLTGGTNTAVGDTVDYSKETGANGVTVDLGANTATDTFGNTDTLSGIENAIGTAQADTLTGSAGANVFTGKGGADTIHGGAGSDAAKFSGNQSDYTITWNGTIATVTDNRGGAPDGTDTIDGVGELRFADHSVWLVGQPVSNDFTTIQSAVDAAHSGDTVLVANGTYTEQVTVAGAGKNGLTIIGESEAGVIVKAPAVLASNGVAPSNGRNVDGMITVDDADGVTITKLTVDGDTKGNLVVGASNPTMVGIAYLNSDDGMIDDVTVIRVREPDGSFGVQRNLGIFVSNTNPSGAAPTTPSAVEAAALNSIEIKNATVSDFQKGGIVVSFANASIHDNTVTGYGLTGLTAQNGIQVAGSTGSVVNNTITGIGYNNTAVAIGYAILTFNNRDVAINGNHVTGTGVGDSSGGIAAIGSTGVVVTNNDLHQVIDAIDVYATAGFVDALAPSATSNPGGAFDFSSNAVDANIPFSVFFQPFATSTDAFDVTGTNRDDEIYGASAGDTLAGGDGNDILGGRGGADTMLGGAGNDTLVWTVGEGNDTSIDGGANSDTLELHDTAGSDTIQVVTNGTTITGLGGGLANVTNIETATLDATHGGTDTLDYTGTTVAVNVNLATNSATGFSTVTGTIENVTGGSGADTLTGSAGANTIVGAAGNDAISGAGGDDQLFGGADSDTFNYTVGDGRDTVDGGSTGSDVDTQNVNGTAATETFNINPISGGYLGINIESGISAVAATDANFEVRTTEVEEINIVTNGGGDSVIISGDLGGTGVATSTVHVTGDSGSNSFDASGITGATPVGVVFDGAGGADTLTGGAANDTLIGGDGADTIKGGAGNDTIFGGTNLNASDDSTSDTAAYDHAPGGYSVTFNNDGTISVTDTNTADGNEGTDTLQGIETLNFGGTLISLTANVLVYQGAYSGSGAGTLKASYATIGAALAAAGTLNGDTLVLRPVTFGETVTVDKSVTILGANHGIDGTGARGTESVITGGLRVNADNVTIDGVDLHGAGTFSGPPWPVGFYLLGDNAVLKNSIVDGTGIAGDPLPGVTDPGVTGLSISHNWVKEWTGGGIYVSGNGQGSIDHNTFDHNGNGVVTESTQTIISANHFNNSVGSQVAPLPFVSTDVSAYVTADNTFTGTAQEVSIYPNAPGAQSIIGTVFDDKFKGRDNDGDHGASNGPLTLTGGDGNDIYYVKGTDTVIEQSGVNSGIDEVRATTSATLSANVENLTLLETPAHTENFENFGLGSIADGENGWTVNGPNAARDQEVVHLLDGHGNVFRMSSDPSVADFAGPYSPVLTDQYGGVLTAGEAQTSAVYDGQRMHFEFKPANGADGSRLEVDFGNVNGQDRNNFMVIESFAATGGIRIAVSEPNNVDGDFAIGGTAPNDWRQLVTGIDPNVWHSMDLQVVYKDGPDNDVINIYLDGQFIGTTTTFENYRDLSSPGGGFATHAANAEANQTDRIFFRPSGNGSPNDGANGANQGFYFDNIDYSLFAADGTGNAGANVITGNSGDNNLTGLGGDDTLTGGAGNDSFAYGIGDGRDTVDGGTGTDTQIVNGTAAAETFNVNPVSGTQLGIHIGAGAATLANADIVTTAVEEIVINTGNGGDTVNVSGNLNGTGVSISTITVTGGAGNDTVDASGLASTHHIAFSGGAGDDTFVSSNAGGNDSFVGGANGAGGDTLDYSHVTGSGVSVNLTTGSAAGAGSDALSGVENVIGTAQNDSFVGASGVANSFVGGGGSDTLNYAAESGSGAIAVNLSGGSFGGGAPAAGHAVDRGGATDTLSGIENITADNATYGDIVGLDGAFAEWTIAFATDHWTATKGAETHEFRGVEQLSFLNGGSPQTVHLVDPGHAASGYTSVQDAVNHAASGDIILLASGTFAGAIDIGGGAATGGAKDITILGANHGQDPSSWALGTESIIDRIASINGDLTVDGVKVVEKTVGANFANPGFWEAITFSGDAGDSISIVNSTVTIDATAASQESGFGIDIGYDTGDITIDNVDVTPFTGFSDQGTGFTFGYGVWINGTSDTNRDITVTDSSFDGGLNRFQSIAFDGQVGGPQIDISNNTFGDIGPNGLGAIRVEDFANTFGGPFDYSGIDNNTFVNAPNGSSGGASYYGLIRDGSGEVVAIGTSTYAGPVTYDQVITAFSTASGQTLTGGANADIVVGSNASGSGDTITAGGGNDHVEALAGNDAITGGTGNDTINGGAGIDMAQFAGALDGYSIAAGATALTVTDTQPGVAGDDGTDTLTGVEYLSFNGQRVLYVDGRAGHEAAPYHTVQDALAASADGDIILVAPGTYNEGALQVDHDVTILGANHGVSASGARGSETIINGGIYVHHDGAAVDGIELLHGATLAGNPAGIYVDVSNVTITNSILTGDDVVGKPGIVTPYGSTLSGLQITDNAVSHWYQGFYLNPSVQVIDTGNTYDANDVANVFDGPLSGSTVTGNTYTNSVDGHIGYVVYQASEDVGATIGVNTFDSSGGRIGIFALGSAGQNVTGTQYADYMEDDSTSGNAIFHGGAGDDSLLGGNGDNTLDGGAGSDTVNAGDGNDTVTGTADGVNDSYSGGSGTDTIDYAALGSSQSISLNLGTGVAAGSAIGTDTLSSFENANGGAGNDSLFGSNANNIIHGGGGIDNIVGSGGSDQLFGEAGNDTLNGGVNDFALTPAAANDVLWGGADTDTFRFEGRFGDDSIGTVGHADWSDGEDMIFVGYASQTPIIADVSGGVLISIDDGSVASSVFIAGATSAQMQQLISGSDLIIH